MTAPEPQRSVRKPLLIGCIIAAILLLLCGGGLIFLGQKGVQAFRAGMEQAADDEKFAQEWTAPAADAPAETFAPPTVAEYDLTSSDDEASFPALGIKHEGTRSIYQQGDAAVEVSVYRMNETEKTAVFDEVLRRIDDDDRFRSTSHVRMPRSLRFDISPPDLHGLLWHGAGWLVFVRSSTVSDLKPFLQAYLEAVETGTNAAENGTNATPTESEPSSSPTEAPIPDEPAAPDESAGSDEDSL